MANRMPPFLITSPDGRARVRAAGQRTLFVLWVLFAILCRDAWGATKGAFLQEQFADLDSLLLRTAALPKSSLKENEPVNAFFHRLLGRYPEIVQILRTNAKGTIVNDAEPLGRPEELRVNASDSAWHANPCRNLGPWHSPLMKDNRRPYLVWSRPLTVRTAIGRQQFHGVVAFKIDVFACFKNFAAHVDGPFEILLDGRSFYYLSWSDTIPFNETSVVIPGAIVLALRLPKAVGEVRTPPAAGPQAAERAAPVPRPTEAESLTKEEDGGAALQGEVPVQRSRVSGDLWLWVAAVALILAGVFGAVFIAGRARRRVARDRTGPDVGAPDWAKESADIAAHAGSTDAAEEVTEIGAGAASVPAAAPEELSDLQTSGAPPPGNAAPDAASEAQQADAEPVLGPDDRQRIRNEERKRVEEQYAQEIRAGLREALTAEIRAGLAAEVRAEVEANERDAIYKKEREALTSAVRRELAEQDRPTVVEMQRKRLFAEISESVTKSLSAEYEEKARAALQAEVAKKVADKEADRIRNEETERLRETLRARIIEEEAPKLARTMRESLAREIREKLETGEGDVIRKGILAEIRAGVRDELLATERVRIRAEQLEKLERELSGEIVAAEKEKIRSALLDKVAREERERVESEDRPAILEAERSRLLAEESPALREELRRKIRSQEMEAIRESVKSEIYLETVQAIRNGLEEKYASAVKDQLAGMKQGLGKKARTDLKSGLEHDYVGLTEGVEHLLGFLADSEALKSLGQTVTLLSEEKKKYKYFNLNAVQTESLLDYLKRVHARFSIYLDDVDQRVRGLMLKLGSLKNKLDSEE